MTSLVQVQKRYNRSSLLYDFFNYPLEKLILKKWRRKVIPTLRGKVLEIGVGTGRNLEYYDYNKVNLTALDISEGMLRKAKKVAAEGQLPVAFVLNKQETLPFPHSSFDRIVTTCVLCSVPDQIKMLKEMKRVLKKDGRMILLEHMLSDNIFLRLLEKIHNPITRLFGFNINRPTVKNLKACGLKVKAKNYALYDIFRELEVRK